MGTGLNKEEAVARLAELKQQIKELDGFSTHYGLNWKIEFGYYDKVVDEDDYWQSSSMRC